ncbi:uncharacterized protein LOC131028572 isoform X5 [Cryptomeria japonica]|uniref:uncharacterized protein LOC131028572 isoform X5 n=1 Tax=Cryptomeria japonica TaxID=3369 RepID=UPI0025ABA700|nr:uncharacterized protein LOC131028572 isoform X5 [Cryptomeria japonica]
MLGGEMKRRRNLECIPGRLPLLMTSTILKKAKEPLWMTKSCLTTCDASCSDVSGSIGCSWSLSHLRGSTPEGKGTNLCTRRDVGAATYERLRASTKQGIDNALQWVQEDTITLFTTEGLMQIGGSVVPRRINNSQEEDYMDPNQGLCLGAIFDIAATNGLDLGRRFCIFGFCRSIEMLSDVVEDTVLEQGGEVVIAEKESKGGLQEKLTMTVAVPLLWGIPPAAERLRFAVRTGGGIVEKIYWQWNF